MELNDLVLSVSGCPANKPGIFFYGPNATGGIPFYDGFLCVSGGLIRFTPQTTSAQQLLDEGVQSVVIVGRSAKAAEAGEPVANAAQQFQRG